MTQSTLDEARASIGWYCMSECKAQCCKRGKLALTEDQVTAIAKDAPVLKHANGMFVVELSNGGCPSLKDNKCTAYGDALRPKACAEFPLMLVGKTVMTIDWCPAVQKRMFDEYFVKLQAEGYKIIE